MHVYLCDREDRNTRVSMIAKFYGFHMRLLLLYRNHALFQPRFQALSPFPPLSSRETLVAAGHVTMRLQQYCREGGSLRPFCQGEQ